MGRHSDSGDEVEDDEIEDDVVDTFVLSDDDEEDAGRTSFNHKASRTHSREHDGGGQKNGYAPASHSKKGAGKKPRGAKSRIAKVKAKTGTPIRRAQGKAKSRKKYV